jgi:tryptophan-rich sensory protein
MAFAAWKVWLTQHFSRLGALTWWVLVLVLNVGWSVLFFGWHRPGWALPVICLGAAMASFCIRAFRPLSREAAWLMTPYLAWAVFLCAFNIAVWTVNGGILKRFIS